MHLIKEELRTRADEISEFLELIKFLEEVEIITGEPENSRVITLSLKNTLKGQVFLLLYNLIEATMRESIGYIQYVLTERKISFNQLRAELRKEILKRAKSKDVGLDELWKETASDISRQLLAATFEKKKIFSGNINHKEICEQAKIYGFKTETEYTETKHGNSLEIIKDKRNNLAHGNSSFSEIGKHYSIQDIENFVNEVINYLESITTHITDYLSQQGYLMKQDELSSTDQ
jgi:hypothetical protein